MQLVQLAEADARPAAHAWRTPAAGWGLALLGAGALAATAGPPEVSGRALALALGLAALLALGDLLGVALEDGVELTPAPALLLAGVWALSWPAALLAAALGVLLAALLGRAVARLRRPPGAPLRVAASRGVLVLLLAAVAGLTHDPGVAPFTAPLGLVGLALASAACYGVALAGPPGVWRSPRALRRRLAALRWRPALGAALGAALAVLWYASPWALPWGLAALAAAQHLARAQARLRTREAELRELTQRHEESAGRLERLQSLATTMNAARGVEEMLPVLCERLAALLGARAGWVALADEGGALRLMASHNLPAAAGPAAALSHAAYAALMQGGRVVLSADERRYELAPAAARADAWRWPAVLGIPLIGEQRPLGAICLAFEHLRGLEADEQRVLTSFAHGAAVAIENARLFDELRHKQAELIQSSKLAAVGTFAAGTAHEFNNLLGSMLGHAQLARAEDSAAEKDRALDVVVQACLRGRSVTRGLLTFARRSEQRRELSDLADAIDETLTLVAIDLRKAQVAVVRQIEPAPPTVCDLGQIAQVVLNLVTNARDAMRPDGGTLTVGLRERGGVIELSVADTGAGIAEPVRERLFEPFVTTKGAHAAGAAAAGDSQPHGTGLGLSISYGIVKDHGGEIVVDSTPGAGTTMTVRLPIVQG